MQSVAKNSLVNMSTTLADRLEHICERIHRVCQYVQRDPDDITIMAVTKTFGPDVVREAAESGIRCFGENRVQEAIEKKPLCPGNVEWHFIGHLQSNKARLAVAHFDMIHSIDSWKLLELVNAAAQQEGRTMPVCLQVNLAGEGSKYGFAPDALSSTLERIGALGNVNAVGFMAIPPFTPNPADARPYFKRLYELRASSRRDFGLSLDVMSMGMSRDFEIAIEEGATCIRLGTCLFGERGQARRGKN